MECGCIHGQGHHIAFAGHCITAVLVATWWHNFVLLTSLIHLVENVLEDLHEHDTTVLLPAGTLEPTTTTKRTFMGWRAVVPGHQH
jgi:hypothetical protein